MKPFNQRPAGSVLGTMRQMSRQPNSPNDWEPLANVRRGAIGLIFSDFHCIEARSVANRPFITVLGSNLSGGLKFGRRGKVVQRFQSIQQPSNFTRFQTSRALDRKRTFI